MSISRKPSICPNCGSALWLAVVTLDLRDPHRQVITCRLGIFVVLGADASGTLMPYPESSKSADARPPVQSAEIECASDAICPYHKGLIASNGAPEGSVYWCPIGRQYWRYRKQTNDGFKSHLRYPKLGIV